MFKIENNQKSWEKIIKAFANSNLSKRDFCNSKDIPKNKFYYWCNKIRPDLKSELHNTRGADSPFLPVKTKKIEKPLSVTINSKINLSFESLPDPAWLASLIINSGTIDD